MVVIFIILVVAGVEVLATTPPREPKVQHQCGPNQEYKECGSSCEPSCSDLDSAPQACSDVCVKGCFCKDGYLKDDSGNCVLNCPLPVCDKPNEVAKDCGSYCEIRTCEDYNRTDIMCPAVCVRGCFCREGYVRNADGDCIPKEKCPPPGQCGPHQEYKECGSSCEPSCSDLDNPPQACSDVCVKGCFCKDGYLKDDSGNCVPRSDCPLPVCDKPNEVAKDCGSYCEIRTCEDYNRTDIICPAVCVRGCFCREGYVRNADGDCITKEKCLPHGQCGPHQEFKECGSSCEPSCSDLDNPPQACSDVCVKGCFCKDGYLKDDSGNCVPRSHCPLPVCDKPNEVAKDCGSYCEIRTCEDYNRTDIMCPAVCVRGCFCREGYVRNADGDCIPKEKCLPHGQCGPHQEFKECGSSCEPSCSDLDNPPQACSDVCVKGCFCKDGYLKDDSGNCVPRSHCPLPVCDKPNEVAKDCGSYCEIRTCEDYNRTDIMCPAVCVRGCFCREGYVRNADGDCIPKEKCPPKPVCLQENEEYQSCGSSCPDNCENYMNPDRICTMQCVAGCNCKPGYVRNLEDNACIKPEQCPPKPVCLQENEEYQSCGSSCPDNCENYMNPDRICTMQCVAGCNCKPGYVRNLEDNACIKPEQCPAPICEENEEYMECGTACPITCDNYKNPPKICTQQCVEDCFCKEGYVRNRFGSCVKPEECEPTCPAGEKWSECSAHCQDTCENYNSPNRVCTRQCQSGCVCAQGTVRRKDGKCVQPTKCNNDLCPVNEVYDSCITPNCPPGKSCAQVCRPGCRCKDGLVRDKNGKCGNPKCPKNERWVDCVLGLCIPLSCDQLGFPIACPDISGPCAGGCVCVDNYVRDSNNYCIPKQNCPSCNNDFNATSGCGIHCGRQCTDYKNPPNCAIPMPCQYNGCDCKKGYVYDIVSDRCVDPVDCPVPCKGDLYAEKVKCPNPCPATCARPTTAVCPRACLKEGCQCKVGYVLGPDGKCVRPENCPDNLGCNGDPNSQINSCVSLCQPTCGESPRFCPALCRLGCACKSGYILSATDGICIKPDKCVNTTTNDMHATTTDQHATGTTHATTTGGQQNANTSLTIQLCTDPNAIRKKCASHESCRATCAVPNPKICPKICIVDGCECKQGYVLSQPKGKCVKIEDCPKDAPCNGDRNAVITANPPPCPSTCKSPDASYLCRRTAPPVACQCKDGYIQDTDGGKCIKPDKCPGGNPCGENSTFVSCRSLCDRDYCPVNDKPVITPCELPYPCPSGCICKLNYKKKSVKDDRCIIASTCPRVNCTRPNEVWHPCPECLAESCADVNKQPTTCNTLVLNCQPQCVCKKGYFRNTTISGSFSKDICIPEKDCPQNKPCEDPYAERKECAPAPSCRSTCATPNPSPCIEMCAINQCVCKKGYVLSTKDGKCIPVDQCPKDVPCNGDRNAVIKANPIPCPSTCSAPNASPWCKKYAPPVGCECKPGYLLNDDGKCITPDQCPGGNPCGQNATFAQCNFGCPTNNCPVGNSTAIVACSPPYPCPSGCVCKKGYKRRSSSDDTCILLSDCPKNQCSDSNAERVECALASECRATCANPNPPCIYQICIKNECVCKEGYVLSEKGGKCISLNQCPPPIKCKANEVYNPCRAICPPQTCASIYTSYSCQVPAKCEPGCDCVSGYLRNGTDKDPCIPSNLCPTSPPDIPDCDINEHYETNTNKCQLTCKNYHSEPVMGACQTTSACFCDDGYVRNSNGQCISKKRCPQNIVCPPNEVLSECYNSCHTTCRTRLRSDGRMCSLACTETGCLCKEGYMRHDNGTCVPISQCSPPRCNDDETYSKCGTACPPTCQNRGDNCTVCTDQCVEDCFCNKGLVRSDDGSCIKPKDCPPRICGSNEELDPCPPTCPPTDGCSNMWSKFDCSNAVKCCKPQCRCKPGCLRKDKDCVPIEQCLN